MVCFMRCEHLFTTLAVTIIPVGPEGESPPQDFGDAHRGLSKCREIIARCARSVFCGQNIVAWGHVWYWSTM